MRSHCFVTIALILCPALGLAEDAGVPRTIDEDGPAQGVQPLVLNELWRVGGEDEDVIFGRITDLKLHPDGSLYVLDNQLCQVVVIGPDGAHLRDVSREGDGPGELRQPMGLVFLADDVLGVGMGFPGKLVTMGLDGTPIGTHYPVGAPAEGNVAVMISLQYADGMLGASGGSIVIAPGTEGHTERFISVSDASCSEFHRILETTTPFDPTGYVFVETDRYYIDRSWALGSGGRIYAPMKRDAYEISEFDTEGRLVRVFGRKYRPRERTAAEKGLVTPTIDPGIPENTDWTIADHDACVTRIMVHPGDGTIWVLTPHGHEEQPPGILETWDVFAPDGEYLRQVPIPLGEEIHEGTCFLVGQGRLVVVRGTGSSFYAAQDDGETEIEPLEVICYGMQ
jgi:hypothetical protein